MKYIMQLAVIPILLLLKSCSFAPFISTPNARTNAAGQHAVMGALVEGKNPSFRYDYGLLGNLDVGAEGEVGFGTQSLGIHSKYSFQPSGAGLSQAVILGLGNNLIGDGSYWYVGPVISYKMSFFEPAFILRYTDSSTDDVDFHQSTGGITFAGEHLRYWYWVMSATLWPTETIGAVVQFADTLNVKGGGKLIDGMIFSAGLQLKF